MSKKYFVDKNGNKLGFFIDGAQPQEGSIEVPFPPSNNHKFVDGEWVVDNDKLWADIRHKRNKLLADNDSFFCTGHPLNSEAMNNFRQALLDLPQIFENPEDVIWPENPLEK